MRLIDQETAAKKKGVSKQAIQKLSREWGFFVDTEIDMDHPNWKLYLAGKRLNHVKKLTGNSTGRKRSGKKSTKKKSKTTGRKKTAKKSKQKPAGKSKTLNKKKLSKKKSSVKPEIIIKDQEDQLLAPTSLKEQKILVDIRKLNIEIYARLNMLIDKRIVNSKVGALGQAIQSNFVDLSKRVSREICEKCGIVGMEKKVDAIVSKEIQRGLHSIKLKVIEIQEIKND